jgi:hypothetical protein
MVATRRLQVHGNRFQGEHTMGTQDKLTRDDINQWIDNDEHLYGWANCERRRGVSRSRFITINRAELEAAIRAQLNRKPAPGY